MQRDAIAAGRRRFDEVLARVVAIPGPSLSRDHEWRGAVIELRHRLYHLYQFLQEGANRVRGSGEMPGLVVQACMARWDLHSLLLRLPGADLDLEPKPGEWSVRLVMQHVNEAQDWWTWLAGWWAALAGTGRPLPPRPPGAEIPDRMRRDQPEVAAGSIAEIRARLDGMLDGGLAAMSAIAAAGHLDDAVTIWQRRAPVDVRYYPYRWVGHLREHTIQVEKTLAWLGREPTEQERIARRLAEAFGALEGEVLLGDPAPLGACLARVESELAEVEAAAG